MKPFHSIIERPLLYYRQWDFFIFTVLTLLSVVNGQSTVFYLLYFFWWNEFVRWVVDRLCYKRNKNAVYEITRNNSFFESLFLMGVYWVFLVVIFGFIAAVDSPDAVIITNMEVLMFHNWFFNINLIFVLLERWYLHQTQQPLHVYFDAFNPNTIVLHVSIIVGGALMFFVVRNYPEIFTPENRWGSALIILPFLLLRMLMQKLTTSDNIIQKQNNS